MWYIEYMITWLPNHQKILNYQWWYMITESLMVVYDYSITEYLI
jgi:hypothetical protein